MLKLYYSKGSSALAAHILLEEVGTKYQLVEISIPDGAHRSEAFLARNPKGRIPVLETPDGMISENPAILEFIATTHPQSGCLPNGVYEQAQARALCAYLCATVHVAYAHQYRGARWAITDASIADMQERVPTNLAQCAALLEADLALAPWGLGAQYSFCDPYLFLLGRWMSGVGVSLEGYPRLTAHRTAMLARPATQAALLAHGLGAK